MSGDPILTVDGLVAGYVTDLPILRDVALSVRRGAVTVIIGPNGAGKSTLVKAIAGLVPVSAGSIRLDGTEITGVRPDRMAAMGVAYVPQTDNIFRSLTIQENLALVLRRDRAARARMEELYAQFPALAGKRHERAAALSGGQRQFLAVAMALATKPSVLLLDEPSAGLAPKATQEVLALVRGLTDTGVSILLVEQNVNQALRHADHCYILAEGRNQLDGPAAEMLADPVVGEIYLGRKRVAAT